MILTASFCELEFALTLEHSISIFYRRVVKLHCKSQVENPSRFIPLPSTFTKIALFRVGRYISATRRYDRQASARLNSGYTRKPNWRLKNPCSIENCPGSVDSSDKVGNLSA